MDQKKTEDKFFKMKYMGYCLAQMPPEEAETSLEDFINHCKFQLCVLSNRLLKDPIWEAYTDEDIIVEYFAHRVEKDQEFKDTLEARFKGFDEDTYDWFDEMIEKNQEELKTFKEKVAEEAEEINYSPNGSGE